MAANTGQLAGKVIFITGASRGIGRAIALKAARDGANIVIAAKTKDPHPKLPGTIYTVAEEVEKAGGRCLPCVVDIRFEDQVQAAVDQTIKAFGRLDVLVNNASAISLTNTVDTSMKMYDLMNGINTRGTYLCSKLCIPHLAKSQTGSHILNISPPLNMSPIWFRDHTAYTIAKYGMSLCALGMADELKDRNIAVNTLWPKTAIYTAAMEMLGGGKEIQKQCRKPDIVADAAYLAFSQPSNFTGNFLIDEVFLKEKGGVTEFDQYACVPGSDLVPDFFLDVADYDKFKTIAKGGKKQEGVEKTFQEINKLLTEESVKSVGGSFAFILTGTEPSTWFLDLKTGSGAAGKLDPARVGDFDVQMTMTSDSFIEMFKGTLRPTKAYMAGELKIKGNVFLGVKLESLMKKIVAKP